MQYVMYVHVHSPSTRESPNGSCGPDVDLLAARSVNPSLMPDLATPSSKIAAVVVLPSKAGNLGSISCTVQSCERAVLSVVVGIRILTKVQGEVSGCSQSLPRGWKLDRLHDEPPGQGSSAGWRVVWVLSFLRARLSPGDDANAPAIRL